MYESVFKESLSGCNEVHWLPVDVKAEKAWLCEDRRRIVVLVARKLCHYLKENDRYRFGGYMNIGRRTVAEVLALGKASS